jgi:hypothetical protein
MTALSNVDNLYSKKDGQSWALANLALIKQLTWIDYGQLHTKFV